ncbi:restriction endonuclease subunit S [Alcanivorax marinus]|uniref:Restriction endonuclease subunit S n=1 Tax=Alloalcanivorax marinus TaxID=1177169 RepID=A0A9Q3UQT4_9GAMM|nr:restriction endonuclease subunit S [Alloalcanivorax marinus]MCC4309373.1 restriction endonuclease subunit S [Alloalcanivorax marinus]
MMHMRKLGEVAEVVMGQAPAGSSYNNDGVGLPLVAGAGDFGEMYPEVKKYTSQPSKISQPGDIILGIRASIGEKVLSDKEYCLGRGVAGVRAADSIDGQYLWHCLEYVAPALKSKGRGATFLQVNRNDICSLEIPLPPLKEQKRIAKILDAADALRAKRRESLAQLDALLQSTFLDLFGDPAANPKAWAVSSIGDVCEVGTGSTPSRNNKENFSGKVPWVKSTEVDWGVIFDTGEKVSEIGVSNARLKTFPKGSLVVALYGQGKTRGKCAILGIEAAMNQACAGIYPNEHLRKEYLFYVLKQSYLRLRGEARGGNQENLNLSLLKSFSIPVPPVSLQDKFSRSCEVVNAQKKWLVDHQKGLESLFLSLQQRAFSGEL